MNRSPIALDAIAFTGPVRRAARTALGLLVCVNVMSQLDRQIMNVLLPGVQKELLLSDAQAGLLIGFAFAVCYALAGIPLARIADRGNRSALIATCLAVWSAMTAACGMARSFAELFLARVGVGIGEAGCAPAAYSILSDHFPPAQRGRALASYQVAIPIGILIGSIAGGWLSDRLPWRTVFLIFGLPGLALALFIRFALHEPIRGGSDGRDGRSVAGAEPISEVLRFFARHLQSALRFCK